MGASTRQAIARAADHHAFLWTALTGGFAVPGFKPGSDAAIEAV
jgi:hypothetical protein